MASCRAVGYVGTDPERLRCALHELRDLLVAPPGAGYGVAHYAGDAVLLNRRPDVDVTGKPFAEMLGGVSTRLCLAHAHPHRDKPVPARDLQPFKVRNWAFAAVGEVGDGTHAAERLRAELLDGLPDFLARDVEGYTCAEALCHRVAFALHQAGQLQNSREPEAVARAVRTVADELAATARECGVEGEVEANLVATDGHRLYVLRRGGPVAYTQRTAIANCELCYTGNGSGVPFALRESHQRFRAIVVAVDAEGFGENWRQVERGAVLVVDASIEVSVI